MCFCLLLFLNFNVNNTTRSPSQHDSLVVRNIEELASVLLDASNIQCVDGRTTEHTVVVVLHLVGHSVFVVWLKAKVLKVFSSILSEWI